MIDLLLVVSLYEVTADMFGYIELFYKPQRRPAALEFSSSKEPEKQDGQTSQHLGQYVQEV